MFSPCGPSFGKRNPNEDCQYDGEAVRQWTWSDEGAPDLAVQVQTHHFVLGTIRYRQRALPKLLSW